MIFNGNFDEEETWKEGEARESKLVFIGKNLNKEELTKAFHACSASKEAQEKRLKMLRFALGDKVQCKTGPNQWSDGEVVQLMYRDEQMPPGMVAPYQVKLDSGSLIYAPADEEELIRKA